MQNTFRNFLLPPVFAEDENKTRVAGLLNTILLALLSLILLTLPISLFFSLQLAQRRPMATVNLLITIFFVVFLILLRQLLFRGTVAPVAWVILISTWLATAYLIYNYGSVSNILPILFVLSLFFAIHTLGRGAGFISLGVTSVVMLALGLLEQAGRLPAKPSLSVMDQFFYYLGVGLVMVVLTGTVQRNILTAYKHTYDNEKVLRKSNQELLSLHAALEKHASDRTTELEERTAQLQTISRLARTIASMQELDTLLPNVTRLVSEQFGFYHTGIFLLDEANKYAVLKAANSEGGIRLLHREHRLLLDSESVVGYAASRGEPRIALDVESDSVYFNNPDLPQTRSEMALPLRVVGRVIGALDVQSTETNAFSQDDIFVLYTLADQIAIAIENARLYGQAQKALRDSQATFDKYVKQEWGSFIQQSNHNGFVFDGKHVVPLDKQSKREHIKPVIQTGRLLRQRSSSTIAVPIKLRGQTIGMLDARSKKGSREWTADEIALLEAAAERAALALENARLVESAQRRASRERSIGEISAKIGSVSDTDLILQAAVEELGRKLSGATEVSLEINSNDRQALQ